MFISVTRLGLKDLYKFPLFAILSVKSVSQIKKAKGMLYFSTKKEKGKLSFMTLSVWEKKQDMLDYRNQGAHLQAMKKTSAIASLAQSHNWESDKIPGWEEAVEKLNIAKESKHLLTKS